MTETMTITAPTMTMTLTPLSLPDASRHGEKSPWNTAVTTVYMPKAMPPTTTTPITSEKPRSTSWSKEAALAKMGAWKSRPRQTRQNSRECRELEPSNRALLKPTPSIHIHSPNCTCTSTPTAEEAARHQREDETMARKIMEESDLYLMHHSIRVRSRRKTCSGGMSGYFPNQTQHRQTQSTLLPVALQGAVSWFFSSSNQASTPAPTKPKTQVCPRRLANLSYAVSILDMTEVCRLLSTPNTDEAPSSPSDIVNSCTKEDGTTPLMALLRSRHIQNKPKSLLAMASFLLDLGADPNAVCPLYDSQGNISVLAAACTLPGITGDVVRLLIDRGAAVDARLTSFSTGAFRGDRMTALHCAAFVGGRQESIEALLGYGHADVNATVTIKRQEWDTSSSVWGPRWVTKSVSNVTALHLATLAHSKTTYVPNTETSVVQTLLRYGGINLAEARDSSSGSGSSSSSSSNKEKRGRTPLHWAVEQGNAAVVRELLFVLPSGLPTGSSSQMDIMLADADVSDAEGSTPLCVLVKRLEEGKDRWDYPEIVKLLLRSGANPSLRFPSPRHGGALVSLRDRLMAMENGRWKGAYERILREVFGEFEPVEL